MVEQRYLRYASNAYNVPIILFQSVCVGSNPAFPTKKYFKKGLTKQKLFTIFNNVKK